MGWGLGDSGRDDHDGDSQRGGEAGASMNDEPVNQKRRPRGWTAIVDLAETLRLDAGVALWRWERGLPVSAEEELIARIVFAAHAPRTERQGRALQKVLQGVRELLARARAELHSPDQTEVGPGESGAGG